MKRGDLFFCKPPGFVGKIRPAVIIQSDEFNDGATSVTLCLLTSYIAESKLRVTIDPTPENGLEKRSQVMIDKVMTLPVDRLVNRIGGVTREQLDAISASLRAWQDL
ncbi:MAG: type II toxin-antitoxin system PemK/MazF family toxin [Pseudomonadota bacterium]